MNFAVPFLMMLAADGSSSAMIVEAFLAAIDKGDSTADRWLAPGAKMTIRGRQGAMSENSWPFKRFGCTRMSINESKDFGELDGKITGRVNVVFNCPAPNGQTQQFNIRFLLQEGKIVGALD